MPSVGELLRRERERQGLDLAYIAQQTRIKIQYLEALERDDFASLPGVFFARSFTTQYASRLGMETAELKQALDRQLAPPEILPDAETKGAPRGSWEKQFTVDPLPEGTASALTARKLTNSLIMLVAVVIACGTVFWLWQRSQLGSTSASESPPPPAAAAESSAQAIVPQTVSPPAAQPAIPSPTPEPVAAQQPVPPAAAGAITQQPPPVPPPGRIQLRIVAKEDTWVRVTTDGKVVAARVLKSGVTFVASANDSARVLSGNAGGIDVQFNGADIGRVGPRGQVRTVDFTPENFTIIEPRKKEPTPEEAPQDPPLGER
jgi:cytoskeletal protein RodZ